MTNTTEPILISLFTNKGGVGKTTTTHEFGCVLAKELGYKVMLVDADAQCDLTRSLCRNYLIRLGKTHLQRKLSATDDELVELGIEIFDTQSKLELKAKSTYSTTGQCLRALVKGEKRLDDLVENTELYHAKEFGELYLLPGDDDEIHEAESELSQAVISTSLLLGFLRQLPAFPQAFIRNLAKKNNIDFVLIDLNPGHGPLNQVLLMGSDYYILPILPEYRSRRAVLTFSNMFIRWDNNLSKCRTGDFGMPEAPFFLGYVCQRVKIRKNATERKPEELPSVYKGEIAATRNAFKEILMKRVRIKEGFTLPPAPNIPEGNSFAVATVATGIPFSYIDAERLDQPTIKKTTVDSKSFDFKKRYLYYIKMILKNMSNEHLFTSNYYSRFPSVSPTLSLEPGVGESRKRKLKISKPVLKATDPLSHNASLYFQAIRNEGGGNCAFLSLGIAREELVNQLLEVASDPDARQSLSEEIYEAVISKHSLAKNLDLTDLLDNLKGKEAALDDERRKLRDRFPEAPKEKDNTAGTILNDWLEENDHAQEASLLSSLAEMATTAQTKVMNFLKTEAVFIHYIDSLRNDGVWMGYAAACLYAKVKGNIEIRVWEMQSPTELVLRKHQPSTASPAPLDILYQRGSHFLKLKRVPAPAPTSVSEEKVEESKVENFHEETQEIFKRTRSHSAALKALTQSNSPTVFGGSTPQVKQGKLEKTPEDSLRNV